MFQGQSAGNPDGGGRKADPCGGVKEEGAVRAGGGGGFGAGGEGEGAGGAAGEGC